MFKIDPAELSTEPYLKIARREFSPKTWDLVGYNARNELELSGLGPVLYGSSAALRLAA